MFEDFLEPRFWIGSELPTTRPEDRLRQFKSTPRLRIDLLLAFRDQFCINLAGMIVGCLCVGKLRL